MKQGGGLENKNQKVGGGKTNDNIIKIYKKEIIK